MRIAILWICLFLWMPAGWAGGIQLGLHAPRWLGMGQTGAGLALDGGSLFFNAGALPFVPKRLNLQFGTAALRQVTGYLAPFSIQVVGAEPLILTPVDVAATWRGRPGTLRGRFTFGLGVHNPFGGGTRWPDTWQGKFLAQEFLVNTLYLQATVAYRLTERIGIGGGPVYGLGNLSQRRALNVAGFNGTESSAQFSGTGNGMGYTLGLYLRANDRLTVGLGYRSPLTVDIRQGWARFNVPESVQENYPEMRFRSRLKLPGELRLGLGLRPEQRTYLALDLQAVGWGVMDSLPLTLEQPVNGLAYFPLRRWQHTLAVRIGAEYQASDRWTWRGGLFYDPSPVPSDYLSPELPDANRIGLSVGGSLQWGARVMVDLAGQFSFTGERTGSFSVANFAGTYQQTAAVLALGIRYTR